MSPRTDTATTPEGWAENFADSSRLGWYHRFSFSIDHRWRLIRHHVRRGGRVLDAGCGAGEWVAFLNENGYAAEGVDFSSELIERTRVLYPQYQWRVASVQQLPYADESFDAVISWGVIEHDERGPAATLEEFWRVLKHGGVAIVTVPVDTDRQRRSSQAHFPPDLARRGSVAFFQYFMTVNELADFARQAGFDVIDNGLQRSPSITLFTPELSARLSLRVRNWLNKAARLLLWWHRSSMNMTYCVATKIQSASTLR